MWRSILRLLRAKRAFGDPDSLSKFRLFGALMIFATWAIVITIRLFYLMIVATTRQLGERSVQILILGSVVAAGFFAHEFKKRDRYLYGGIEVCFGIGTAIVLVFSSSPLELHLSQWSSLVGAAYVIARGRNNVQDAKEYPATSPTLRLLRRTTQQQPV